MSIHSDINSDHNPDSAELARKDRKAASQRRYYQRNKLEQQEKARIRAHRRRVQRKCTLGTASITSISSPPSTPASSSMGDVSSSPSFPTPDSTDHPAAVPPCSPPPYLRTHSSSPDTHHTPSPSPHQFTGSPAPIPPLTSVADRSPESIEPVQGLPSDIYLFWPSWTARRRMSAIRRWILDVEWREGRFDSWTPNLMSEWRDRQTSGAQALAAERLREWSGRYTRKVTIGLLILQYIGRVMDGPLQGGSGTSELSLQEECTDLALQIHQLAPPLSSAIAGLEVSLKWIQE